MIKNLHSSMDRLKVLKGEKLWQIIKDLHSSMDRLKACRAAARGIDKPRFTFQYG